MDTSFKIHSVKDISLLIKKARQNGKKIVYCHGEFDILHLGHMRYFKAAKKFGDLLVVTLTPDRFISKGPGRPVFNEEYRAEAISNLEFVDFVGINEWETAEKTIEILKPDIYVKGNEYLNKIDVTGRLEKEKIIVESVGGEMRFTDEVIFSSSKLLNNNFDIYTKESKFFLQSLSQEINAMEILKALKKVNDLKILVIGESKVDSYNICEKHTCTNNKFILENQINIPIGVIQCINVLAEFCKNIDLITLAGQELKNIQQITPNKVNSIFEENLSITFPTITRFFDKETCFELFNVANPKRYNISSEHEKKIIDQIDGNLAHYDCIMVIDQGLGMFTKTIIDIICKQSKYLSLSLGDGIDLQKRSFANYYNIDYICLSNSLILQDVEFTSLVNLEKYFSFRSSATSQVTLIQENENIIYWNHQKNETIPAFIKEKQPFLTFEKNAIISPLMACCNLLKFNKKWTMLIGNVIASMSKISDNKAFSFNKLLFEKFIIALLNR